MRTIYGKIVGSFFLAIVLSMLVAFLLATAVNERDIRERFANDMMRAAQEFAHLYGKSNIDDAASFLSHTGIARYTFVVYDRNMGQQAAGGPPVPIAQADVWRVLGGAVYSSDFDKRMKPPASFTVGIPFQENGETYALFVHASPAPPIREAQRIQLIQLAVILVIGTLLFAYVSHILVRPIRRLIAATEQVGKGKYDINVPVHSRDEIGTLTRQFNQMTHELNKIEEMRQEFVAAVSHEIQSPLTSIQGFAKALKNEETETWRLAYVNIIEQESARLSQLGRSLMKLASLDAEQHPFHPKRYRVDEQIRRVLSALAPQWEEKELQLDIGLPKTFLTGDEDLLEQVWTNLLTNAIRYTLRQGIIHIRLVACDSNIICTIKDYGPGIAKEEQTHIFERFYKVDKSRSAGGNGLGLAIVKKIVLLHHGDVKVESELGSGSSFHVVLPSGE
ncbi:HAMP domain-containing histidine kinase [Ectobacillus sp. JY-23]|uniref:sensor histidine kinase n=1 Tax=Ectobacillus sp. JY-23 TaxID=2933872 RepID=UPI001FF108EC|nr:HAMP domain-containing sensor histidine kinase [Ectobacillus sp. JY-23]UOY92481.1 HAMP domain-containing histidine kinase [Ectobacillus sp. JY-23]